MLICWKDWSKVAKTCKKGIKEQVEHFKTFVPYIYEQVDKYKASRYVNMKQVMKEYNTKI